MFAQHRHSSLEAAVRHRRCVRAQVHGGITHARLRIAVALAVTALVSGSAVAGGANPEVAPPGGTITFSGAILAPPFDISTRPGRAPAAANGFTPRAVGAANANTTTVTFATPSGGEPTATVALSGPRGPVQGIGARFVDASGRVQPADRGGAYHVGVQGGTLSLGASSAAVAARSSVAVGGGPIPVMVVVSYD